MADTAIIEIRIYDGTRQLMTADQTVLIRVFNGKNQQVAVFDDAGNSVNFEVPYYDNLGDYYRVTASSSGYSDAGFVPVHISRDTPQVVDLMLLPKRYSFNFSEARWDLLEQANAALFALLTNGVTVEQAQSRYEQLMAQRPLALAALLNITTAMNAIRFSAKSPLGYCAQMIWDNSLAQDRFFAYADPELIQQVRIAAQQGLFVEEKNPGSMHPGATLSYKQVQFGEANVQLTFHQHDTKKIGEIQCVKLEPDIDYYQDPLAHAILEVIPNHFTQGLTNPVPVYALRWMAGRRFGLGDFDPLYSIEEEAA